MLSSFRENLEKIEHALTFVTRLSRWWNTVGGEGAYLRGSVSGMSLFRYALPVR